MKRIFFWMLFTVLAIQSFAWSQTGHRVVGEIANQYITGKTRRAIKEILGNESIAIASNWADFIKSEPAMKQYDAWHYINFKSGLAFEAFNAYLQTDTAIDAYTKINFLIGELKNKNLPLEQKRMYLRLLIHIVGDIHQPLHVGRPDDLGGNRIKVMWFNESTNLHSVWDGTLIDFQKLSYTEYAKSINYVTKAQKKEWQQQNLAAVFFESYSLAEKIYAGITQPEQKLGFRYNYDYIDMLNTQLLKGGVRLAGILNDIFK